MTHSLISRCSPCALCYLDYRKIPKISPGVYFLKALFEGLIFGGAYIRRGSSTEGNLRFKIDWASLTVRSKFTVLALFYLRAIFHVQAPKGGGGREWREGLYLEGLIHGGDYFGILRYTKNFSNKMELHMA